jgi:pSer/pThr/pTyr-binding forkhead associated (FHA) protein
MTIQATRLETEKDVRRALQAVRPNGRAVPPPIPTGPAPPDDSPALFRPSLRPATPILTICDDGAESGETVRVRKKEYVIGRTEGDLTIPHDGQMSSRHAALRQTTVKDQVRWAPVDLESTNGTFVRVGHAVLEHGSEFINSSTRETLDNPPLIHTSSATFQPDPAAI